MAVRNANDAISMVQTAEGAIGEMNMLQRCVNLLFRQRLERCHLLTKAAADVEFEALDAEILRVSQNTEWNGTKLLDGSLNASAATAFQVGAKVSQTISVFSDFSTEGVSSISAQTTESLSLRVH